MLSEAQRPNLPPSILSQKKEVFLFALVIWFCRRLVFFLEGFCRFNNLSPSKKNVALSEPASSGPS